MSAVRLPRKGKAEAERILARLPFADTEWRFRWVVTRAYGKLHRVIAVKRRISGRLVKTVSGATACGYIGELQMPGILSRLGRERCAHCCHAMKIPLGYGAPFNQGWNA